MSIGPPVTPPGNFWKSHGGFGRPSCAGLSIAVGVCVALCDHSRRSRISANSIVAGHWLLEEDASVPELFIGQITAPKLGSVPRPNVAI